MTDTATDAEIPLGKYHVVRALKTGGTAAIYLAILRGENHFTREVVIKRPLAHLVSDPRARLMFVDEAHIASRLSHPNICPVLDLVAREDEMFLVLEYLRGVDLREVLKRAIELGRPIPPEVAAWIGIEVSAGLDFAHAAVGFDGRPLGIIHRDVSPKNIRITDGGAVKVIDFGIARAAMRATETAEGTIKGTMGYMSPEQILGEQIDRRSDVFAFGVVLFQMLTSMNPFDGASLRERVRRLTIEPIPSLLSVQPELGPEIAAIVGQCLERDVELRFRRMREVQSALEQYLARFQLPSPRQRLVEYLESIFPKLHDPDPELATALHRVRAYSGPVDATLPVRFPDDEGARHIQRALRESGDLQPPGPSNVMTRPTRPEQARSVPPAFGPERPDDTAQLPERRPEPRSSASFWVAGLLFVSVLALGAAIFIARPETVEPAPQAAALEAARIPTSSGTDVVAAGARVEPVIHTLETVAEKPSERVRPAAEADAGGGSKAGSEAGSDARGRAPSDVHRARLYFKTALRLERAGDAENALLLYTLAVRASGARVDSALFRNLAILHHKLAHEAKARACFLAYLEKRPDAPDADRIRALLEGTKPADVGPCLSSAELQSAERERAARAGRIEGWLSETLAERLK